MCQLSFDRNRIEALANGVGAADGIAPVPTFRRGSETELVEGVPWHSLALE
jgi:hypothetical protein